MENIGKRIADIRRDYAGKPLDESIVDADPLKQFGLWMHEAIVSETGDPNAMSLATTSNGQISVRIVLLKGFDERGFIFFTNYGSRKAQDIASNPNAALNFFWPGLMRQVNIEGSLSKVSDEESEKYFAGRPRESQLGAWASDQSREIDSRKTLDDRYAHFEKEFRDGPVVKPPNWGGFCLKPVYFEFWQGRMGRLHDRIAYKPEKSNWRIVRLAP